MAHPSDQAPIALVMSSLALQPGAMWRPFQWRPSCQGRAAGCGTQMGRRTNPKPIQKIRLRV